MSQPSGFPVPNTPPHRPAGSTRVTRQARGQLADFVTPVAGLDAGVGRERKRLEGILATGVAGRLRAGRSSWQRLISDEVIDRWQGGPFATFLHVIAALGSLWQRMRPAGGLVGRLLAFDASGAA